MPELALSKVQQFTGLRQGRVYVRATGPGGVLKVDYKPIYGQDEPLLLLGPDGRLLKKLYLGHRTPGSVSLKMNEGPGEYVLILKPSYLCSVSVVSGDIVYEPPSERSGIRRKYDSKPLYFNVPADTASFDFLWVNHRGYKGEAARMKLIDPKGKVVAEKSLSKVSQKTLLKKMKSRGVDVSEINSSAGSGNFNPSTNPAAPEKIHVKRPVPGVWQLQIGTTGQKPADDVGFWLQGIPSYFISDAQTLKRNNSGEFWLPSPSRDTVAATVTVEAQVLPTPVLGVVGPFGAKGGLQEKTMSSYGIQGEKVYLHHNHEEASNDNSDHNVTQTSRFTFKDQHHLYNRHDKYSLVVLDRWADWIKRLPKQRQPLEWGEWAGAAVANLIQVRKMDPDQMTVQFLNEANKYLELKQYLPLFKAAATKIKSNPDTRDCKIGAPAIATGMSHHSPIKGFLDTRWIEAVLKEADSLVDHIVINVYGASELEDTFLYGDLAEKVSSLVKQINTDNTIEPIIIGATNREGGLVSNRLFNSWDGALWWASVLTQVINSGEIKVVNYFNIIDKGIRKKGLFTSDRKPKSQARIQKMFAEVLSKGRVYRTTTDHSGLEAITVKSGSTMSMLLVNKSRYTIDASLNHPHGKIQKLVQFSNNGVSERNLKQSNSTLILEPQTVMLVEFR